MFRTSPCRKRSLGRGLRSLASKLSSAYASSSRIRADDIIFQRWTPSAFCSPKTSPPSFSTVAKCGTHRATTLSTISLTPATKRGTVSYFDKYAQSPVQMEARPGSRAFGNLPGALKYDCHCFIRSRLNGCCTQARFCSSSFKPRSYSSQRGASVIANPRDDVASRPHSNHVEPLSQQAISQLLTRKSGLFDDHQQSYGIKSTSAIIRALAFFFICRFDIFTTNAEKIMNVTRRILGRRLADYLIRFLVYDQFVVAPNRDAIMKAVKDLDQYGVGVLLAVPIEDDAGSHKVNEMTLDHNLDLILGCVDMASDIGLADPLVQLRVTALMSGTLAKIVAEMSSKSAVPNINYKGNPDVPISVATIDAMVKAMQGEGFHFLQLPGWEEFPEDKVEEFKRSLGRFGALAKSIKEHDITAMIDAEYTYLNPALRHLVFALMELCNKDKPRVFYTYQAYLKSTYSMLSKDLALAQSRGTCFGVKLVRGAYMVKERHLASVEGYDDPVNDTFDTTSDSYHRCLDLLLEKAKENERSLRFILASHNEDTLYFAFQRMDQLGLSPLSPAIMFGQLYGMADHISFVLGASGCRIVKSVPYGTMDDTIPYLARRAQENKSVLLNARKEREMLRKSLADKVFRVFT